MRITIAGPPGSGKSSVAKALAEKLNLKHYSAGEIRRKIAEQKGITLEELNRLDEKTHEADKIADKFQKKLGKKEDNFVIDGRLPHFFIPDSFKVFLYVEPKVGAQRVMERRKGVEVYKTVEEAQKKLAERESSDRKRYRDLYNIDYDKKGNFDICINTTGMNVETIVNEIVKFVRKNR